MNCHFWNTLVFLVRSLSSVAAATLVTFSSPRQRLVDLDTVAIAVAVVIASPRRSVTSGLKGKKRETWRQLFFYYFVFPPFLHLAAKTPDSAKRRVARATAFRASRGRCDWSSAPGPRGPLLQRFLSCPPPPFPPVLLLLPLQVLQWCVASSKPRAEKGWRRRSSEATDSVPLSCWLWKTTTLWRLAAPGRRVSETLTESHISCGDSYLIFYGRAGPE